MWFPPIPFLADLPVDGRVVLLALGALLCVAVGVHLGIRLARGVLRGRIARTRRVGRRGERRALALLDRAGYRVIAREVTAEGALEVDGEIRPYLVRADALVGKRRARWVAEFKGGAEVGRFTHRDTRRQLLEYAAVFDVDGVLLVDARRDRVHVVRFPGPRGRRGRP